VRFVSRRHSVLPGFGITMGLTLMYLSLIVLVPLGTLLLRSTFMGWEVFWAEVTAPRVVASLRVSFTASLIAALLNAVFGAIVAWVLVRYDFPGKKVVDALVDLPFALPTAVSGIALATIFAGNGWLGSILEPMGIRLTNSFGGIVVALTLIGLPFIVRTLQPALEDLEAEMEEASASLGAGRLQTLTRVIVPSVLPAHLTGFAMAFARAVGEFGSVIFIAGNLPFRTEIAPLLIFMQLEQRDYDGAIAIAVVMLIFSFVMLLAINLLQWWSRRYQIAAGG
jgi:sulfate transport system permease protein